VLQERGFDIGLQPAQSEARLDAIYTHARQALYATVDDAVVRDASPRSARVRTAATSRDDYLAHPQAGERLREDDVPAITALCTVRHAPVQFVVSDGLNANAVNEQLRTLLPAVRGLLSRRGRDVAETDVVVRNGRVRAGYQIGGLVSADVVIHMIGERPGTGLNTLSAYLTYGRDVAGQLRWSGQLDHSATTAVCGIHRKGKTPEDAAVEIARTVDRMFEQRKSGVALQPDSR
jgi:ethanolamine ammonia-lyase small subunit